MTFISRPEGAGSKMIHDEHQGSWNYETFLVKVMLENTAESQKGWRETTKESIEFAMGKNLPERKHWFLADCLKRWCEGLQTTAEDGLHKHVDKHFFTENNLFLVINLLSAAIENVNFDEIARQWTEEYELQEAQAK